MEEEWLTNSRPRRSVQFGGSEDVQPSGTTHVEVPAVEIRSLTSCAGDPTWIVNVDYGPSFPSLDRPVRYGGLGGE